MKQVEAFRQKYRLSIGPWYNGYWHMTFVGVTGLAFVYWQLILLPSWTRKVGLTLLLTLVVWNFIEHFVHKHLGHKRRRLSGLFYQRHTGDHHSFFSESLMVPETHKDWRVTLFPPWLVIANGVIAFAVGWLIGNVLGDEIGHTIAAGLMVGYLLYEFFHFCDHLPSNHFLLKLPWVRHMRQLHKLHHRRALMHRYNFNLTFPLADWLLGTFYWEDNVNRVDDKTVTKQ